MADHHNELQEGSAQAPNEQDRLISLSSPMLPPAGHEISYQIGPNIFLHISFPVNMEHSRLRVRCRALLATIYPGTLLPMSVYALVRALSAIIFSPTVGAFID